MICSQDVDPKLGIGLGLPLPPLPLRLRYPRDEPGGRRVRLWAAAAISVPQDNGRVQRRHQ